MTSQANIDEHWMRHALRLAQKAEQEGEVPIGAVLVLNNELIGEGWNQPISHCDPSAHAEIMALRAGAKSLQNYRLIDTSLYVTLEPCIMCAGALVHARVKRVVFATHDPRAGAVESVFSLLQNQNLNHQCEFTSGIYAEKSSAMLKQFFQNKRN